MTSEVKEVAETEISLVEEESDSSSEGAEAAVVVDEPTMTMETRAQTEEVVLSIVEVNQKLTMKQREDRETSHWRDRVRIEPPDQRSRCLSKVDARWLGEERDLEDPIKGTGTMVLKVPSRCKSSIGEVLLRVFSGVGDAESIESLGLPTSPRNLPDKDLSKKVVLSVSSVSREHCGSRTAKIQSFRGNSLKAEPKTFELSVRSAERVSVPCDRYKFPRRWKNVHCVVRDSAGGAEGARVRGERRRFAGRGVSEPGTRVDDRLYGGQTDRRTWTLYRGRWEPMWVRDEKVRVRGGSGGHRTTMYDPGVVDRLGPRRG